MHLLGGDHGLVAEAAFGAIGLETMLSAALSLYHNDNMPLERLVAAMSQVPAKLLGLEGGRLEAGEPADFTVVDPNLSWKVDAASLCSRSKNSPFERRTLEGRAIETVVAGRTVYTYVP